MEQREDLIDMLCFFLRQKVEKLALMNKTKKRRHDQSGGGGGTEPLGKLTCFKFRFTNFLFKVIA